MSRTDHTGQVVVFWLEKAEKSLAAAEDEHKAEREDFAVNRAYYAAFYAASAALLKANKRFAKHSGLRAAVHRDLVKSGRLDTELGRAFDRLFESRQRADYLEFVRFESEEAEHLISIARDFVAAMRRLVEADDRKDERPRRKT